MGSPLCAMLTLLIAACCHLMLASGERAGAGGYREEIVFPERLVGEAKAGVSGEGLGGSPSQQLLYRIRALGEDLVLDLERDPSFLAEGLTVQYLGRSGQPAAVDGSTEPGSYYTGTVNSDPDSVAAVNYDGVSLLGVLQYHGAEYHVQPLQGGAPNAADGAGAHVLRKKIPEKANSTMCSVGAQALGTAPASGREPHAAAASSRRAKRFASVPRYVETLVVADEPMAQFHGAGLRRYLLTVMAAAAKFFRHPSLQNPVTLVVTRLVVLGPGEDGLQVTANAAQMLRNFCQWQKGLNKPDDADSEHFDTAIFFTRQNLCGISTCDTLGMADVGTVCDPTRSCSIVEDDGLQSAFTAAHELGHVFNMLHDNAKACEDLNSHASGTRHMMAPVMSYVDPDQLWSPCSARFITDFLDNGHGHCLLDKPREPLRLPAPFPGSNYDVDRQCQLTFGPDSRHCPNLHPPCSSLWCTGKINGHFMCQTKHFPWADGTACGQGKACMNGRCISRVEMKAFNTPTPGGWGPWGPWGECSRSCGGGVQFSTRECNKPVPRNGGKYCEGKRTQYRSCSTQECPDGTALTFREQQCAAYNHHSDLFKGYPAPMDWVPRYSGVAEKDQCKLTCQSRALGYYYVLEPRVADGTPCSPDSTSVCVQGRCIHAGCDHVIGSKKKFDKCMVCGGDGSRCSKTYGSFAKPRYGYNDVVTIPAGATHILIRQSSSSATANDGIYLALRRQDGTYALNGNYVLVPSELDVSLAGSVTLHYSGATKATEIITGRGPLHEPLTLQALVVSDQKAPRLKYTFFKPTQQKQTTEQWLKQKAQILEILKNRRIRKEPPQH
ncbi:A disintegrin and metalloproteinase with thrombospondin motifs 4 [Chelonoidis abingdonii]|uniref:A disintegrin and metalloproteinase with thrombospondin motifs 4 n=1 Tax=Chelonoidis abingdonii TaxID=106734 RepID=UPI0013F1C462|nr:A disintegrin and metalloproteinase with thrombospondin motifs 4 [Chelonoidis abingdonii]